MKKFDYIGAGITEESHSDTLKQVRKEGYIILTPNAGELFIDIDSRRQRQDFERAFEVFKRTLYPDALITYEGPSRSGKWYHQHIIVYIGDGKFLTPKETIYCQAMLRSDPTRELLSMARIQRGTNNPNVLFETDETMKAIYEARSKVHGWEKDYNWWPDGDIIQIEDK